MSWQPYIDDHLLAELPHGGHLDHAAITGHSGDIWASSPSFPELSQEEVEAIVAGFDDQAKLAQKGLFLGGNKYIVIAGDEGAVIRGQKGREGVTIKKTGSALVFGLYGPKAAAGEANSVVENVGDYLIEAGM